MPCLGPQASAVPLLPPPSRLCHIFLCPLTQTCPLDGKAPLGGRGQEEPQQVGSCPPPPSKLGLASEVSRVCISGVSDPGCTIYAHQSPRLPPLPGAPCPSDSGPSRGTLPACHFSSWVLRARRPGPTGSCHLHGLPTCPSDTPCALWPSALADCSLQEPRQVLSQAPGGPGQPQI